MKIRKKSNAYRRGRSRVSSRYHALTDNPYPEGSREHVEWAAGFQEAVAESVASILPENVQGDESPTETKP